METLEEKGETIYFSVVCVDLETMAREQDVLREVVVRIFCWPV